jgi:hypothetical protein
LGNALFAADDFANSVAAFDRSIAIDSVARAIQGPHMIALAEYCGSTDGWSKAADRRRR